MFQPIRSALLIKKPLLHEVTFEVSPEISREPSHGFNLEATNGVYPDSSQSLGAQVVLGTEQNDSSENQHEGAF